VQLFPERDRRGRRLLLIGLTLSLLVHAAGGGASGVFARLGPAVAKLLPHPEPTPAEFVATSDAITIEKRTVPRAMRRTPAQPRSTRPRRTAQAPPPRPAPAAVPTLAPPAVGVPTAEPVAVPTYRPRRATIHHPRPGATPPPRLVARHLTTEPSPIPMPTARPAARGAFSPQQIAALDAQFSKTIAQTQRALSNVPKQLHAPATTRKRWQYVMAGSHDDVLTAQAECDVTATWFRGPLVWHYEICRIVYGDGFSEQVSIPWPLSYARNDDIVDHPDKVYVIPDPPRGWALPHPFAFSRLICIFYRSECEALIARERANGDPDYAPP
jgi:hypothetical protein